MEASLAVPTATSFREVPAKLLEVNRRVINGYLGRTRGGKVSFTHLIGYAVVRAIAETMPVMNSTFAARRRRQAAPSSATSTSASASPSTSRSPTAAARCSCPCIRDADTLDFRSFWTAYEDLIRKVRTNKLIPDDFAGTTVTLTNPGTHRHACSRCRA